MRTSSLVDLIIQGVEPPRFVCLRSTTERLLKLADPLVHVLRPPGRLGLPVASSAAPSKRGCFASLPVTGNSSLPPFPLTSGTASGRPSGCTYGAPYLADGARPPAFSWTTFAACRPCYTGKLHRPCRYGRWMLPSPPKQRLGASTHRIAAGMSHDATSGFTARYGLRFRVGVPEPAWVRCPPLSACFRRDSHLFALGPRYMALDSYHVETLTHGCSLLAAHALERN